jgi:hypothetical protein
MNKPQKDNLYIKTLIEENNPFFIGRIAGCELKIAHNFYKGDLFDIADELRELENNAGIKIQNSDSLAKYSRKLVTAYDNCTIIAEWEQVGKVFQKTGSSQKFIQVRTPNIPKIDARALEPYYFKESWMSAMKNKKILIIHPFVKTIQKQIKQLDKIFPNQSWFENCTFEIIAPPFTLAGNHQNKDWEEHLDEFIGRLKQVKEFDIALIAAGGYGMLIADLIFTEMKKSVMYVGGALQIFFGIIGKRWFENKDILKLVNDDWIRPNREDKPLNFQNVEKGCYW